MAEYVFSGVVEHKDGGLSVNITSRPRERIVRCRDCAHCDGDAGCTLLDFATDKDIGDGFCAWASERDQNE